MTRFVYTVFAPSLQKYIGLYELSFQNYKQILKLILNDHNTYVATAFNDLITQLIAEKIESKLTFLDKLIVLLTVRSVCIFPTLELTFAHAQTKQDYNLTFEISDIISRINKSSLFIGLNNTTVEYKNFKITFGIPEDLYYLREEDLMYSTIKNIQIKNKHNTYEDVTKYKKDILEQLPVYVYRDAREHVKKIEQEITQITLLSVKSPASTDESIEITPSIFQNSSLEFLKLCFKRDLTSMYELEYFLMSKLRLSNNIVMNSTYAELMTYIGFYNEERKKRETAEKKQFVNPLAAPR